jgi:hypothetical protein
MDGSTELVSPRPVTVWFVPLGRGPEGADGIKGKLWVEDTPEDGSAPCVRFIEADGGGDRRFRFASIRKVRRVKGSPILIIEHEAPTLGLPQERVAFYFTKPPPLHPPEPSEQEDLGLRSQGIRALVPFGLGRRPSKRRHQRTNVRYLTTVATTKKEEIQMWVVAVQSRMRGK